MCFGFVKLTYVNALHIYEGLSTVPIAFVFNLLSNIDAFSSVTDSLNRKVSQAIILFFRPLSIMTDFVFYLFLKRQSRSIFGQQGHFDLDLELSRNINSCIPPPPPSLPSQFQENLSVLLTNSKFSLAFDICHVVWNPFY
ncbi:hypothetical protein NPIL_220191 [Nephila pilipes]|uniref:Uncharacterized protein n=1 Tax=Nephila pilipes TaxID=299642 RepID=A0A8X6T997_NEPPI|nr:hypothetical protein NPIL_220191 [Nephila pilipes]